jgi:hypothetical protein
VAETTLGMVRINLISDLQTTRVTHNQVVLVVGKTTMGDGLGGFYRWDANSTAAVESVFMNVVASSVTTKGRWLRIFQRARSLAQGVLVNNGGVKTLYATGTTDANGRITINLTEENTAAGTALFTDVWLTTGEATNGAATPNDVATGSRVSLSTDKKVLVYQFSRGNSSVVSLLGVNVLGMRAVASGTPVAVRIDGV